MNNRFDGFCVLTNDVVRLRDFYAAVLRAETEGDEIHSLVRLDTCSFAIFDPSKTEVQDVFAKRSGRGSVILEFEVDDVDSEYQRLLQGIEPEFLIPPRSNPHGRRAMHFLDPDGNIVNFHTTIS